MPCRVCVPFMASRVLSALCNPFVVRARRFCVCRSGAFSAPACFRRAAALCGLSLEKFLGRDVVPFRAPACLSALCARNWGRVVEVGVVADPRAFLRKPPKWRSSFQSFYLAPKGEKLLFQLRALQCVVAQGHLRAGVALTAHTAGGVKLLAEHFQRLRPLALSPQEAR